MKSLHSKESSVESPPLPAFPPGRRRVIVALLVLAVVLGVLAGWGWLRGGAPARSHGADQALTTVAGPSTSGLNAVPVATVSAPATADGNGGSGGSGSGGSGSGGSGSGGDNGAGSGSGSGGGSGSGSGSGGGSGSSSGPGGGSGGGGSGGGSTAPIGAGTYLVGTDIAVGDWTTGQQLSVCVYRVNNLPQVSVSLILLSTTVHLVVGDTFTNSGCSTWRHSG